MRRFVLLVAAALTSFCLGAPVHADFTLHRWERHRELRGAIVLKFEPWFALPTSNYDGSGQRLMPTGFSSLWRQGGDITAEFGIAHWLTVFARGSWFFQQLNSTARFGTSYGFGDQTVGLNLKVGEFFGGWSQLSFQGQFDFPLYSNAAADTYLVPYLGDQSFDFTGGLFWGQRLTEVLGSDLVFNLGAGFTYRTAGFSMAIPTSLAVELSPRKKGLLLAASAYGVFSLRNDAFTGAGAGRSFVGSGGSFLVNAINPTTVTAGGLIGYQFNPAWSIWLGAQQGVWGINSAQTTFVSATVQVRLGAIEGKKDTALTPEQFNRSNQGFLQYNLEAKVSKVQDKMSLLMINRGATDLVEVGQVFDIFRGQGEVTTQQALARAKVTAVKGKEAVLEITEFFREGWIDPGFVARRVVSAP